MIFQLSEESRERISKVLDLGRVALHYGWIPLVIYVGEYDRRCDTVEDVTKRCDTKVVTQNEAGLLPLPVCAFCPTQIVPLSPRYIN